VAAGPGPHLGHARDRPGEEGEKPAGAAAGLPQGPRCGQPEEGRETGRDIGPDARGFGREGPEASDGECGHAAGVDRAGVSEFRRGAAGTGQAVSGDG